MPDGFKEVGVKENGDLFYNYAIQLKKSDFEVRYSVVSLKSLLEE